MEPHHSYLLDTTQTSHLLTLYATLLFSSALYITTRQKTHSAVLVTAPQGSEPFNMHTHTHVQDRQDKKKTNTAVVLKEHSEPNSTATKITK